MGGCAGKGGSEYVLIAYGSLLHKQTFLHYSQQFVLGMHRSGYSCSCLPVLCILIYTLSVSVFFIFFIIPSPVSLSLSLSLSSSPSSPFTQFSNIQRSPKIGSVEQV